MKLFQILIAASLLLSTTIVLSKTPDPVLPNPPLAVREANVDANDWIAVHEQGIANVDIQNTELDVKVTGGSIDANVTGGSINANISGGSVTVDNTDSNPVPVNVENLPSQQDVWVEGGVMTPVTRAYYDYFDLDSQKSSGLQYFTGGPILATLIYVSHNNDKIKVRFFSEALAPAGPYHSILFIDAKEGGGPDHTISLTYPVEMDGFEIRCENDVNTCEVKITVVGF